MRFHNHNLLVDYIPELYSFDPFFHCVSRDIFHTAKMYLYPTGRQIHVHGLVGYQINRLEHSLQTATRALKDKASDEMIVAALIHDIGDELAPNNHSEFAATILKPYVGEKTRWIVEKHGIFQMYYYAHHLGGNKNQRDKYKGHKYFQETVDFCENWDQKSFDPNYKSLTLKDFETYVKKIFSRTPYTQ